MRMYMRSACDWLARRHFYTWLHRLQASNLMVDHYGAGRTCEMLYSMAQDFDRRVGHLEQAREHYVMSLREGVNTRKSKLSMEVFNHRSHRSHRSHLSR